MRRLEILGTMIDPKGSTFEAIVKKDVVVNPAYFLQTVTKMKSVKFGVGTIPPSQVFVARIKGPVHTVTSHKAGDESNDGFAH